MVPLDMRVAVVIRPLAIDPELVFVWAINSFCVLPRSRRAYVPLTDRTVLEFALPTRGWGLQKDLDAVERQEPLAVLRVPSLGAEVTRIMPVCVLGREAFAMCDSSGSVHVVCPQDRSLDCAFNNDGESTWGLAGLCRAAGPNLLAVSANDHAITLFQIPRVSEGLGAWVEPPHAAPVTVMHGVEHAHGAAERGLRVAPRPGLISGQGCDHQLSHRRAWRRRPRDQALPPGEPSSRTSVEAQAPRARLAGPEHNIPSLDFSPCGEYIASASIDGRVRVWRVSSATFAYPASEPTMPTCVSEELGEWVWSCLWLPRCGKDGLLPSCRCEAEAADSGPCTASHLLLVATQRTLCLMEYDPRRETLRELARLDNRLSGDSGMERNCMLSFLPGHNTAVYCNQGGAVIFATRIERVEKGGEGAAQRDDDEAGEPAEYSLTLDFHVRAATPILGMSCCSEHGPEGQRTKVYFLDASLGLSCIEISKAADVEALCVDLTGAAPVDPCPVSVA